MDGGNQGPFSCVIDLDEVLFELLSIRASELLFHVPLVIFQRLHQGLWIGYAERKDPIETEEDERLVFFVLLDEPFRGNHADS